MSDKTKVEDINPYDDSREKGSQIEDMFDAIAPAYDFMNTAMSFGLHRCWRDKALKSAFAKLPLSQSHAFLDVATGTGDVAFRLHELRPDAKITGIDLSEGMLKIARKKLDAFPENIREKIAFGKADCLALPFHDGEFSLVTVAYGVRNFSNLLQGLKEMRRVLAGDGVICIIELSEPQNSFTKSLYKLYSRRLIPIVGKRVSGDSRAYTYLPESIAACPQRENMASLLQEAGFNDVEWKSLSFGAVTYYIAR